MLHKFLEQGDWFAPKRVGYGAGLPIAWQGWALMIAYFLAIGGVITALPHLHGSQTLLALAGIGTLTGLFIFIAAKRTRGGWRWRSGEE